MASFAVCFFRAPSWFGVPENDPIEVMSDPPIYADALQAPRERASTLRTPACLVQLSFGRISKAEVIRAVDRKRFGYVGNLTDDSEIILLSLLIHCSIAGESADQVIIHTRDQRPIYAGELHMGGNGGFPILANETQRLYGRADETADLRGLFSNQAVTGRQ